MSDDFDLRLRRELRALADAVPTSSTVRPLATVVGYSADAYPGREPLMAPVRVHHRSPIGFGAAAIALVAVVVAAAALSGGLRGGRPGASAGQSASAGISPTADSGLAALIVQPQVVLSFGSDDLTSVVLGPDGAAYVLDDTAGTVYRVDLQTGARQVVVVAGTAPITGGSIIGKPRVLATGGLDVLILDDFNSLWRWRPEDKAGRGSLVKVNIPDNTSWGNGARAMGTFVVNPDLGLYNLYVVVPSTNQILKYPPALDGSAYPTEGRQNYLADSQDVSRVDDLNIDGDVYLVDGGKITKFALGQADRGWSPADPGARAPYYTRLAADNSALGQGTFYAFDRTDTRIVAFSKQDGALVAQYVTPAGAPSFSELTGMFIAAGVAGASPMQDPMLYWTAGGNLLSAHLGANTVPTAEPSPTATTGPAASQTAASTATAGSSSGATHHFTPTGTMTSTNNGVATPLLDGRVLIIGPSPTSPELYDPARGKFSATGAMAVGRIGETATRLQDGRVLIAGGFDAASLMTATDGASLTSAELYEPATGVFSPTGSMTRGRSYHTATLLDDGRVLIVGGYDPSMGGATVSAALMAYHPGSAGAGTPPRTMLAPGNLASAELYDPATGTFSQTGSMATGRSNETATLLTDGRVLVAGGLTDGTLSLASAELYDPRTGKFSQTGAMTTVREMGVATLLSDGRVLIVGGFDRQTNLSIGSAELFDPRTGKFSKTGAMTEPRENPTATRLLDGRVLVTGGYAQNQAGSLASAELFDPTTGAFAAAGSMSTSRENHTATLLPDGRVLLAGGVNSPPMSDGVALASAELYGP